MAPVLTGGDTFKSWGLWGLVLHTPVPSQWSVRLFRRDVVSATDSRPGWMEKGGAERQALHKELVSLASSCLTGDSPRITVDPPLPDEMCEQTGQPCYLPCC